MVTRILFVLIVAVSCSSLETPEYRSPQYASPGKRPASASGSENTNGSAEKILLSWPLKGTVNLTRGFMLGIRPHQGLDITSPRGTPVKAAHDGYVEYAGHDFSGYGKLVIINSGNRWATFYAHLNRIRVVEGQNIKRGERLGDVGATGNARGVHLHFELRYDQRPVDPMEYLP